jgi:arylsulfate sulfotransferase
MPGRLELTRISFLLLCSTAVAYLLSGCAGNSVTPVITPIGAVLLAGQTAQFTDTVNGAPVYEDVWYVNGVMGGSAATGTISSSGLYATPRNLPAQPVIITAGNSQSSTGSIVQFFNPSQFTPGRVAPTSNPIVAQYTVDAPEGANVQIQFGQSTNYGLATWSQPAPEDGGIVSIFVAGMRASMTYHMQALVHLPDGTQVADADHTFTTGPLPSPVSNITVQQTSGMTPAPGVELLCLAPTDQKGELTALVTDLSGNVIWYYDMPPGEYPFPMKLLPNGHMLLVVTPLLTSQGLPAGSEALNEVREVDLAGDVVNRITVSEINTSLTAMGASFQAGSLHHDILALPNGHLLLLVNYGKTFDDLPGLPPGTVVTGDALVDWDPQQGAVWTWSAFDHLDPSRVPYGIANGTADWTHSNALVYSPDDGDILLSMRNQNWIIKINYENGVGDGSILWRFGYQGDFTLPSGQAPIEWNYGQHYIGIVSPNSAGTFSLMFFNNGNNRLVDANNDVCGTVDTVACYSSVPIFDVNEDTKTAQVQWENNLSPAYSICCGNASILLNGDVEYDVAFNVNTPGLSDVQEVTQEQNPQLVWQMNINGPLAYRAFRIPSLYPGVEWTQTAIAASEVPARRASVRGSTRPGK